MQNLGWLLLDIASGPLENLRKKLELTMQEYMTLLELQHIHPHVQLVKIEQQN